MTSIYAEKTQKGYKSALNGFRKFADEFNLDNNILAHSAPTAQPVWIAYALWCKTKAKILQESCRKYLSAFRSMAASYGIELAFPGMLILQATLKAWKRASCHFVAKKVPITEEQVEDLLKEASASKDTRLRQFSALTSFGYHTLCRAKECTEVLWSSMRQHSDRVSFKLASSKTDPFAEQGQSISLSLQAWRTLAALLPKGRSKGRIFAFSPESFRSWIAKKISNGVTGHSLRRGGAQRLFDLGFSAEEIKAKGRWKSDAWRRYIDFSSRQVLLPSSR